MSFLESMGISGSALSALRLRMDVVAENMANMNTTRTAGGGPYRRRYVVFQQIGPDDRSFSSYFNKAKNVGGGVRVSMIGEDDSPLKLDYDPSHPDANEEGFVELPNVEVVQEMVDMMSSYRAYEANITALNTFKDMAIKTLELGK